MSSDPTSLLPPARQARSRLTQDRIFTAGMNLLQEGGAEALTIAAVAQAAGVSVGSVYRRFGDKNRLLAAIQTRFTDDFRAEFEQRVTDRDLHVTTPAADVVAAAVVGVATTFRSHAPLMRVFMLLGTQDPAVFQRGAQASIAGGRTFRDTVMLAAAALRHHADVEAAVDFAYRLTYAACAHRIVHGEHLESGRSLPWPELIDQVSASVVAYLVGHEGQPSLPRGPEAVGAP